MNLYIDLKKAVAAGGSGATAVGQNTNVSSARRKRLTDESYNKNPIGVMGGDGKPDDPDVGPKHNHSTSLDEDLEEEREEYASKQDARNIIRAPKGEDTKKSLAFLECIGDIVEGHDYNPTEREFLTQELGYTNTDLAKGVSLTGNDRSRFGQWLDSRMQESIQNLVGE